MPTKSIKSIRSNHSSKVRTINTSFDHDRLCRYLLAGNRRCQRTQTNTGSGLCILHDRHLTQLRDAQSEALGNQALGNVTDFNSAISIHAVLSRIVMLGLHRRYSTKEVSVFTYAMQSLRQTLEEAAYEIRHHSGLNSRDPLIARAIDAEPSLSQPDESAEDAPEDSVSSAEVVAEPAQAPAPEFSVGAGLAAPTANAGEIPPPDATPTQTVGAQARPRSGQASPTHTPSAPIIDPSDIADVLHSGYVSNQSQESIDNLLKLPNTPEDERALESIRSGLSRIKNHIESVKQSLVSTTKAAADAGLKPIAQSATVGTQLCAPTDNALT